MKNTLNRVDVSLVLYFVIFLGIPRTRETTRDKDWYLCYLTKVSCWKPEITLLKFEIFTFFKRIHNFELRKLRKVDHNTVFKIF